ncbi:hypothetical protein SNE40_022481 [Patella caerulea]|uniref:Glycosyltransferase family 92 protein n=1 Tax=Patella caerulea TaxID=87958 RepID=A0AAN8FWH7_PATCE
MIKKYGHWVILILILYVIAVMYMISTLRSDTASTLGNYYKGQRSAVQTGENRNADKKTINSVIVESAEDDLLNPNVRRNILIERSNNEDKQNDDTSSLPHKTAAKQPTNGLKLTNVSFIPIGNRFHVYSAYFDDRLPDSYIRIIGTGPRNKPKHKSGFWCIYKQQTQRLNRNSTIATEIRLSETCENHKKNNSFYMLSCLVPKIIVKEFRKNGISRVLIGADKSRYNGITMVVVNNSPFRAKNKSMSTFSMCVPSLYGYPKPLHFVEFIELSRQLGVEHFVFYTQSITHEIKNILKFYETQGIVTILHWNIPNPDDIWNYGQSAAVADCLYRNMFKYKIVSFNDIDEFIIPRHLKSWETMLVYLEKQNLRRTKNVAAYKFKSVFFHGNSEYLTSERRMFKTLNNILRTSEESAIRTKLWVYPETVFELGIHHLSHAIKSDLETIEVDSEMALVHHYRRCDDVYDMKCGNFIDDYTAQRYGEMLIYNTRNVLRRVKEDL